MNISEQLRQQIAMLDKQQKKFLDTPEFRPAQGQTSYSTIQFLKAAALLEDIVINYLSANPTEETHVSRLKLEIAFFGSLDTTTTLLATEQTLSERFRSLDLVTLTFLEVRLPALLRVLADGYSTQKGEHPLFKALCSHLTGATQAQLERYLIEAQTSKITKIDPSFLATICADLMVYVDKQK